MMKILGAHYKHSYSYVHVFLLVFMMLRPSALPRPSPRDSRQLLPAGVPSSLAVSTFHVLINNSPGMRSREHTLTCTRTRAHHSMKSRRETYWERVEQGKSEMG